MATLDRAVRELQSERSRLEKELERIDSALNALNSLNSRGGGRGRRPKGRRRPTIRPQRHMSASARARIAAAQKARWAKLRKQKA